MSLLIRYPLGVYGTFQWRRLRWKSHINRTKANGEICQRLTRGDPRTIVAIGDAYFSSSFRGRPPGLVKGLFHKLKKRLGQRKGCRLWCAPCVMVGWSAGRGSGLLKYVSIF